MPHQKKFTLSMVHVKDSILLGMKKRGFGKGWWNGFGGKVLPHESISKTAVRELKEETGITAHNQKKKGILRFSFEHTPELLEVHVFSVSQFKGAPQETDEMMPRWFKKKNIPYELMWPDDKYWLPILLSGKQFSGVFHFNEALHILSYDLQKGTYA